MKHVCECPLAGYCTKHGYTKTAREHQICNGENVSQSERDGWLRLWEGGLLPGRNPDVKSTPKPIRGAGDAVARVIDAGAKALTGKAVKPCSGCKGRQGLLNRVLPFGQIPTLIGVPINKDRLVKHIVYHIMPLGGDSEWVWRRHIEWLREVRHHFNGKLIVGITIKSVRDAEKPWTWSEPSEVKKACDGLDAEFIITHNKTSGEGTTFRRALMQLETQDPDEVVFYGHSKGVTRINQGRESPPQWWAEAMFDTVFRNHADVVDSLDSSGICGAFRMPGGYAIDLPGVGPNWFFSGTFFAFRAIDAFSRNWENVGNFYGCVEQWPQAVFKIGESACSFFPDVRNLYDENYWRSTVFPEFRKWREAHECLL